MRIIKRTCPLTHAMARESPAFPENKKNHFRLLSLIVRKIFHFVPTTIQSFIFD